MISGIFHKGSGLGNQLHRYVMTRVLALDKGYDFGMIAPELFKGKDFMNLDRGNAIKYQYTIKEPEGKVEPRFITEGSTTGIDKFTVGTSILPVWEELDKHCYDPGINFVEDNTIIDGNFEDERYFEHRLPEIKKWLKTEPLDVPNDICVIGFRGGEYYTVPNLGLPREYYSRAIVKMLELNPNFRFEVHTDDPELARSFFPDFPIIQDIGINWRSMRYAKYAIIANSSFYVLPRLLNGGLTIAPRYWNRYNIQKWDYPQNYYKQFKYI